MLKVRSLNTWIGAAQILHDIDLDLNKGEIVCLLGPNGAGKSTLMNSVAGSLSQKKGEILLEGLSIQGLSADQSVRRGLALSPEGRQVFAPLTVQENLQMGAYIRPHSERAQVQQDLDWVLGLFPILAERFTQEAGTLSGGEQQMLAIGRALMSRPKVLLLDEPSLGLAPIIVSEIFATISRLRDDGVSVLLAEQNARMAFGVANRAYVLSEGRIWKTGSTEELAGDDMIQKAYLGL